MGSSFSNSSFQENNGKLSPKTDGKGLGFDFTKEGSLKAMLSLGLQVKNEDKILGHKDLLNLESVSPLGRAHPFRACEKSIEIDSTRIISESRPTNCYTAHTNAQQNYSLALMSNCSIFSFD